jgi:hypothetical protein
MRRKLAVDSKSSDVDRSKIEDERGVLVTVAPTMSVALEIGPKGKKVAAVAPDWPGLERGATSERLAVEKLDAYRPRYAKVAELAGLAKEFAAIERVDVVERYAGVGSTDFWGISFAFSSIDAAPASIEELERELTLLRACWTYFDVVRARVSEELRKGPRGGGRDRDDIVRHTLWAEQDWARKLGVGARGDALITDDKGLETYRARYCEAIRTFHGEDRLARTWPLRFLIRHTAFHTMDHAWEMEDKDLSELSRSFE